MKVKQILMLALAGVLIAALVTTMSCLPPEDGELEAPFIQVSSLSYDPEHETGKIDFAISVDAASSYLVEVDTTDFSQLNLAQDSFVGWTSIEGEPKIPVVRMRVAIPPGMDNDISIDIEEPTLTGTIEDVLIVPVEKYEDPIEPPVYEMKEEIYDSSEQYPATWISQPEAEFFDGFEILTFEICPVRYRPIERDVYFYDIEGSITFHGTFPEGEPRESTPFEPILKDVILNWKEAVLWRPSQIEVDPLLVETVNSALREQQGLTHPTFGYILIIAADDFLDQAEELANHKRTRADSPVPTFVFSVEQIKSLVPTGDIPNRIRQFIRAVYSMYGPPYIILLGDVYMMGGPYAAGEPLDTCFIELGSNIMSQYFVQSFTNAKGVVSVGLLIGKVGNPDYPIQVGIRDTWSTVVPDLVSFEIQPDEVVTGISPAFENWIHKNFPEHVDLDPTQTYYLFAYTKTTDSENYYKLWYRDAYEPDSMSFINRTADGDREIIFSAQLYHSSSVPARYVKVQASWDFYDEGANPSDYYYTCLDHGQNAWDADGDGRYCEYPADNSTMDFYPEGYVGRLPASDVAEATAMVNAIIAYEQTGVTSGGDSVIYCESMWEESSHLYSGADAGDTSVQVHKIGYNNPATVIWNWNFQTNDDVVIIDSAGCELKTIQTWFGTQPPFTLTFTTPLANSYLIANGAKVIKVQSDAPFSWEESDFYPILKQLGGTCNKAWDYRCERYFPRIDAFETVFNSGVHAVQLHAHGLPSRLGEEVTCDLLQNDLQDTNTFPVVFAHSCRTAYYDLRNPEDCLGEAFVVTGKASSYVGCSRFSPEIGSDSAFSILDKCFWIRYNGHPQTGRALAAAKIYLHAQRGLEDYCSRQHILAVELLGDPETLHK